jgi:hypothetical protein
MRGACLLSRRSEDVSIFFGRASVHCEDFFFNPFYLQAVHVYSANGETLRKA